MQLRNNSALQNGKYRIIRVLGQGGFGITYLAENLLLDKKVAIKEFFPKEYCDRDSTSRLTLGTQNNAETVAKLKDRFLKEAKNIAKLDHPGIVKIHDVFEENNTAYYVMDYIEGENLNEMVKLTGPLSEAKAIEYIRKVGDALDYIHAHHMTHFDVKPANIMVRKSDNVPILIDFGLSKQYDFNGDATSTIMQGVSHGFSPIELYNANSISSFSPASDIYSLGATLYYLLTGIVPPSASQILEDGISIPANITMAVGQLIERTMVPARNKRPSTQDVICEIRSLNNLVRDDSEVRDKEVETKSPQSVLEETILAPGSSDLDLNMVEYTKLQETILLLDEELRSKASDISQHKDLLAKKNYEINVLQSNSRALNNQISKLSSQVERKNKSKYTAWTICIVSIVILGTICLATNSSKSYEIERIGKEIEQITSMKNLLGDSLNNYKSALTQRDNIIKTIAQNTDVFISDIEVRNEGEYYGEKIYSRNTTFINPRFKVINLSDNIKDIGVKFYAPFGLATGKTSKDGYSFTESIPAKYGANSAWWYEASGWGNEKKGNWMAGKYRIEFWADGKCIATKHFTVF